MVDEFDTEIKPLAPRESRIPQTPLTRPQNDKEDKKFELDTERVNKAASTILAERTARIVANIAVGIIIALWFVSNAWESEEFILFILEKEWGIFDLFGIIGLWIVHSLVKFIALFAID